MRDKKSNEIADKLREIGNFQFKKGDYHEALVAYNRSLCHALPDTEQFSFAFANRSAVYLKVKLFEKCLQNIELARKHGYPEEKQSKLNEREETCKKLIETFKDEIVETRKDFFKLSYEANKKIPFIVKSLEVREDDKYGRYITTSSNLKPGDIIAIDEPIYKYINSELCHRRCTNCLKSNHLSLIPCLSCSNGKLCKQASA
ncbi:CLUMA_CG001346, isoform A [Clunio marinus]|uniref:CLUMA_CG001346, isoform A n=1 Tax=Clunio marinus TaxID=568069 RepID=A0A1J1HHR9_9DIPT|nr:CLUMA_CG001346, isoform A [Clunio marinus]